jgi:TonB family protein
MVMLLAIVPLAWAQSPVPGKTVKNLEISTTRGQCGGLIVATRAHAIWEAEFTVTPAGNVTDVKLLKTIGTPKFDFAASNSLDRWKYKPYLVNGVPTPIRVTVQTECVFGQGYKITYLDK